jgi:hypothetical protein
MIRSRIVLRSRQPPKARPRGVQRRWASICRCSGRHHRLGASRSISQEVGFAPLIAQPVQIRREGMWNVTNMTREQDSDAGEPRRQ